MLARTSLRAGSQTRREESTRRALPPDTTRLARPDSPKARGPTIRCRPKRAKRPGPPAGSSPPAPAESRAPDRTRSARRLAGFRLRPAARRCPCAARSLPASDRATGRTCAVPQEPPRAVNATASCGESAGALPGRTIRDELRRGETLLRAAFRLRAEGGALLQPARLRCRSAVKFR